MTMAHQEGKESVHLAIRLAAHSEGSAASLWLVSVHTCDEAMAFLVSHRRRVCRRLRLCEFERVEQTNGFAVEAVCDRYKLVFGNAEVWLYGYSLDHCRAMVFVADQI